MFGQAFYKVRRTSESTRVLFDTTSQAPWVRKLDKYLQLKIDCFIVSARGTDMSDVALNDQDQILERLLGFVSRGDEKAFRRLYELTSPRLFRLVVGMLKDEEAARDTLQSVYVSIWKNAGSFDPQKAKAMTWMHVIARNRTYDALRSKRRKTDTEELPEMLVDERSVPPEVVTETALARDKLEVALSRLPERMAKAIRLNVVQGMTSQEIANALGVSRNTVKSWKWRGLKKMRDEMQTESFAAYKF